MTSDEDKRFRLIEQDQSQFETKRTLVGLYKQGPLETTDQFAERVYGETMKAYQASKEAEQERKARQAAKAYRECLQRMGMVTPKPEPTNSDFQGRIKALMPLIELPIRFVFAFIGFTVGGWIGWAGIILLLLRAIGVIHWPWWAAALPLGYGVIYCLYMTIDGALYRAGLKNVGRYARLTQSID